MKFSSTLISKDWVTGHDHAAVLSERILDPEHTLALLCRHREQA